MIGPLQNETIIGLETERTIRDGPKRYRVGAKSPNFEMILKNFPNRHKPPRQNTKSTRTYSGSEEEKARPSIRREEGSP